MLLILVSIIGLVLVIVTHLWCKLRAAAEARLRDLEMRTRGGEGLPITKMVRVKMDPVSLERAKRGSELLLSLRTYELSDSLKKNPVGGGEARPGKPPIGLMSLGDYLATLRPEHSPEALTNEIEAVIAFAMLKALGPRVSGLLPVISHLPISKLAATLNKLPNQEESDYATLAGISIGLGAGLVKMITSMSTLVVGGLLDAMAVAHGPEPTAATGDREGGHSRSGGIMAEVPKEQLELHVPLLDDDIELSSRTGTPQLDELDAVSYMRRGEHMEVSFPEGCFPSPFKFEENLENAVQQLLEVLKKDFEAAHIGEKFDPDAKVIDIPKPINDDMLPGLHLGYGTCVQTHTNREMATSRALICLLNKLAANFLVRNGEAPLVVQIQVNNETIEVKQPDELIKALIDTGHHVQARPRLKLVSFGLGMCVKEDDGTWTNIPTGLCLSTGHMDSMQNSSHCFLTHGGMCLDISGPCLAVEVNIQHHSAIDGFCGWYTCESATVPWLTDQVELWDAPIVGPGVTRIVRVCALYAAMVNASATRRRLPMNGYGLIGVCVDSLAAVEKVITGSCDAYPLLGVPKYHCEACREGQHLLKALESDPSLDQAYASDLRELLGAMGELPNDIFPAPRETLDACRRILNSTPKSLPFQIMVDSKKTLENILEEAKKAA